MDQNHYISNMVYFRPILNFDIVDSSIFFLISSWDSSYKGPAVYDLQK